VIIKTKEQYKKIKTAARINSEVLSYAKSLVEPGISSLEVDKKTEEFLKKQGAKSAFKDYMGYPATINFMQDNQVIHCIPSKDDIVKENAIISVDVGSIVDGYYADQATSFALGNVSKAEIKLLSTAKYSIEVGCRQCIVGNTTGDVGFAQQSIIEMAGFSVVREFVGHEIGKKLHDPLKIPAWGLQRSGDRFQEGHVLCIENQVCMNLPDVYIDKDGWSVYTKDGGKCATFEHMVIVRKDKAEVISSEV
jgi:methionyl aminopeptidase